MDTSSYDSVILKEIFKKDDYVIDQCSLELE